MIITEIIDEKFKKTYSDKGKYIRKKGTDEIYCEAVDLRTKDWQYEETEQDIKEPETKKEENIEVQK